MTGRLDDDPRPPPAGVEEPAPKANSLGPLLFWISGALLSFSAMAISLRELSKTLGVFEMLSLRSASSLLILGAIALAHRGLRSQFRPKRIDLHLYRNAAHFVGTYAWSYSVTILPLALVFSIEFTSPIWTTAIALIVLRERITLPRFGSVALGFIGVLVILRPGADIDPRGLWPLLAAILFAVTFVFTRAMTKRDSTFCILFWMNAIQLPLNLIGANWAAFAKIGQAPMLPLLGVCMAGLVSHVCLTNAFRHGEATLVAPLDFLRLPLIAIVGWRLYGEPLDPFLFAGAGLIIAGVVWSLRAEARGQQPGEAAAISRDSIP